MEEKKAGLPFYKEAPASVKGGEVEAPRSIVSDGAILRKIDWNILPVMFLVYFLQFLDKVALNVREVKEDGCSGCTSHDRHIHWLTLSCVFVLSSD